MVALKKLKKNPLLQALVLIFSKMKKESNSSEKKEIKKLNLRSQSLSEYIASSWAEDWKSSASVINTIEHISRDVLCGYAPRLS